MTPAERLAHLEMASRILAQDALDRGLAVTLQELHGPSGLMGGVVVVIGEERLRAALRAAGCGTRVVMAQEAEA